MDLQAHGRNILIVRSVMLFAALRAACHRLFKSTNQQDGYLSSCSPGVFAKSVLSMPMHPYFRLRLSKFVLLLKTYVENADLAVLLVLPLRLKCVGDFLIIHCLMRKESTVHIPAHEILVLYIVAFIMTLLQLRRKFAMMGQTNDCFP